MLKLSNITKDYKVADTTIRALKGLSLCFRANEFVSVLGPSGCGKTTLLNIVGGLDHCTTGDLSILGRSTKEYTDRDWDVYRNHRVGFIFQSYNLIPHQTVLGNVELALTISGMEKEQRVAKAKAALDKVGLADQYYKKPNQLSGGQCQRVAIARALVNDPEILLADEPTGALDTKTSKQIMDLIQEIAKERLVIMVTHNPELAEEYSTRIIRLLDGELLSDSNPFSEEDEKSASKEAKAQQTARDERVKAESVASGKKSQPKEKAKMSFFTAFKLSLQNLFTKKRRTIMTSVAGSIGIIGVSLVLAVSFGVQGYINNMQNDMLSGNPITVSESALDLTALMQSGDTDVSDIVYQDGKINVNSTIANLVKRSESMTNIMQTNEITQDYIDYVQALPANQVSAVMLDYGLKLSNNLYTSFTPAVGKPSKNADGTVNKGDGTPVNMSLSTIKAIYESVLVETGDYAQYASFISGLDDAFAQIPTQSDYILGQYNLLAGGHYATKADEIMLVLRKDHWLSDLLLAQLGFYSQNEFMNMVFRAVKTEDGAPHADYYPEMDKFHFDYSEVIGHEFTYYPNSVAFEEADGRYTQGRTSDASAFYHRPYENSFSAEEKGKGIKLKIAGILEPKEDLSYGTLSAGFFYTEALRDRIFEIEEEKLSSTEKFSDIVQYLVENGSFSSSYQKNQRVAGQSETSDILQGVTFQYNYVYPYAGDNTNKSTFSAVGTANQMAGMASMFGGMMGLGDMSGVLDALNAKTLTLRDLSGRQVQRASLAADDVLKKISSSDLAAAEQQVGLLASVNTAQDELAVAQTNLSEAQTLLLEVFTMEEAPSPFPDLETFILYRIGQYATAQRTVSAKQDAVRAEWKKVSDLFTYEFKNDQHKITATVTLSGQDPQTVTMIFNRTGGLISSECAPSADNGVAIAVAALYYNAAAASSYSTLTKTPMISSKTMANNISIYPVDFDQKQLVLAYLDAWNADGDIEFTRADGSVAVITRDSRSDVTYSDILSLIFDMIGMFINMITIALVAFTSLALVVSCVMIGIITYVSVVERIKEIGVIRSLGGRKRDVSNLFIAETFIIGLVSGIIGIAATYLLSGVINLIVATLGVTNIAALPWWVALIMVGVSIGLTLISGLMPSQSAAKKDPVVALRTE